MASITKRNGRWTIRFINFDGTRRTLALETTSDRQATNGKLRIEELVSSRKHGRAPDPEVEAWLSKAKPAILNKLVEFKLIDDPDAEKTPTALGDFLTMYVDHKRDDVKPSTKLTWQKPRRNLLEFFGAEKLLSDVTVGDANDFERYLKTSARKMRYGDAEKSSGLKPDTVRRRIGICKQFFNDAVDRKLLSSNPFSKLSSRLKGNRSRDFFITLDMAYKVLDACPDKEWRLIFALSRFGGLRCPSEHLALRLDDVDWDRERIVVHSPKTEHHEGQEYRIIPLFPELRPFVEEVFNAAPEGEEFFITRYRDVNANLRTTLLKIIKRAGLKSWPKLFQNLRASRQTELEEIFPSHVVNKWIGNSREVAEKHYLQVTDDHYSRALQICARDASQASANDRSGIAEPAKTRYVLQGAASKVGDEGLEPPTLSV